MVGALAGARVLVFLAVSAVVVAFLTWLVAVAEMLPVSQVAVWATSGVMFAFGFPFQAGDFALSLPPTLFTAVVAYKLYSAAKRVRVSDDLEASQVLPQQMLTLAGLSGVVACAVVVGALVTNPHVDVIVLARVLVLVVLVPVFGLQIGQENVARWCDDKLSFAWGDAVMDSTPLATRVGGALVIAAHLVIALAITLNYRAGAEVVSGYSAPVIAAVGLGAVQAAFAPTLWAVALTWVSGFPVLAGGGHVFDAARGTDAPLPAIPILAVIPADPIAQALALVAVPIVAVAVAVAFYAGSTMPVVVFACLRVAVVVAAGSLFGFGGIGPGGLQSVGVIPWTVIVGALIWLAGGGLLGIALTKLRDFYDRTRTT